MKGLIFENQTFFNMDEEYRFQRLVKRYHHSAIVLLASFAELGLIWFCPEYIRVVGYFGMILNGMGKFTFVFNGQKNIAYTLSFCFRKTLNCIQVFRHIP